MSSVENNLIRGLDLATAHTGNDNPTKLRRTNSESNLGYSAENITADVNDILSTRRANNDDIDGMSQTSAALSDITETDEGDDVFVDAVETQDADGSDSEDNTLLPGPNEDNDVFVDAVETQDADSNSEIEHIDITSLDDIEPEMRIDYAKIGGYVASAATATLIATGNWEPVYEIATSFVSNGLFCLIPVAGLATYRSQELILAACTRFKDRLVDTTLNGIDNALNGPQTEGSITYDQISNLNTLILNNAPQKEITPAIEQLIPRIPETTLKTVLTRSVNNGADINPAHLEETLEKIARDEGVAFRLGLIAKKTITNRTSALLASAVGEDSSAGTTPIETRPTNQVNETTNEHAQPTQPTVARTLLAAAATGYQEGNLAGRLGAAGLNMVAQAATNALLGPLPATPQVRSDDATNTTGTEGTFISFFSAGLQAIQTYSGAALTQFAGILLNPLIFRANTYLQQTPNVPQEVKDAFAALVPQIHTAIDSGDLTEITRISNAILDLSRDNLLYFNGIAFPYSAPPEDSPAKLYWAENHLADDVNNTKRAFFNAVCSYVQTDLDETQRAHIDTSSPEMFSDLIAIDRERFTPLQTFYSTIGTPPTDDRAFNLNPNAYLFEKLNAANQILVQGVEGASGVLNRTLINLARNVNIDNLVEITDQLRETRRTQQLIREEISGTPSERIAEEQQKLKLNSKMRAVFYCIYEYICGCDSTDYTFFDICSAVEHSDDKERAFEHGMINALWNKSDLSWPKWILARTLFPIVWKITNLFVDHSANGLFGNVDQELGNVTRSSTSSITTPLEAVGTYLGDFAKAQEAYGNNSDNLGSSQDAELTRSMLSPSFNDGRTQEEINKATAQILSNDIPPFGFVNWVDNKFNVFEWAESTQYGLEPPAIVKAFKYGVAFSLTAIAQPFKVLAWLSEKISLGTVRYFARRILEGTIANISESAKVSLQDDPELTLVIYDEIGKVLKLAFEATLEDGNTDDNSNGFPHEETPVRILVKSLLEVIKNGRNQTRTEMRNHFENSNDTLNMLTTTAEGYILPGALDTSVNLILKIYIALVEDPHKLQEQYANILSLINKTVTTRTEPKTGAALEELQQDLANKKSLVNRYLHLILKENVGDVVDDILTGKVSQEIQTCQQHLQEVIRELNFNEDGQPRILLESWKESIENSPNNPELIKNLVDQTEHLLVTTTTAQSPTGDFSENLRNTFDEQLGPFIQRLRKFSTHLNNLHTISVNNQNTINIKEPLSTLREFCSEISNGVDTYNSDYLDVLTNRLRIVLESAARDFERVSLSQQIEPTITAMERALTTIRQNRTTLEMLNNLTEDDEASSLSSFIRAKEAQLGYDSYANRNALKNEYNACIAYIENASRREGSSRPTALDIGELIENLNAINNCLSAEDLSSCQNTINNKISQIRSVCNTQSTNEKSNIVQNANALHAFTGEQIEQFADEIDSNTQLLAKLQQSCRASLNDLSQIEINPVISSVNINLVPDSISMEAKAFAVNMLEALADEGIKLITGSNALKAGLLSVLQREFQKIRGVS